MTTATGHASKPRLLLLSAFFVCAVSVAGCAGLLRQDQHVASQAIATLDGVAFQPPVGTEELLTGNFDPTAELTLELFTLRKGRAFGAPLGPSLSTDTGSISVTNIPGVEEAYEAAWDTSDSKQRDGSVLRAEVRLPRAQPDEPACNGGPRLDSGCLAYVDVKLWRSGTDVESNPSGPGIVDMINGSTLDIRLHIERGALAARTDVEPDLIPPSVELNAPATGSELSLGTSVEVEGVVTEARSTPTVELYADFAFVGTASLESTEDPARWLFKLQWVPATPGEVALRVVAHDGSGNMGASDRIVVVVDDR